MNESEVITWLEANQNERGRQLWQNRQTMPTPFTSYGIGLTKLRKLAKQIGKNHDLATVLWQSDIYEARMLAMLIDDPKTMTRNQAETQVDQLQDGQLAHVFSSCDATLAKTPFVVDLAIDWIKHEDPMRRRCGYGLLYELSKSKKKSAPDDAFFVAQIKQIEQTYATEVPCVNHAMGVALMGIGMRNQPLHAKALQLAQKIGSLQIETDTGQSRTFSVEERLTNEFVLQKLGLA